MLKIENTEVVGWEHAIRGMRNPMNSWNNSDSWFINSDGDIYNIKGEFTTAVPDHIQETIIGENDMELMNKLSKAGSVHRKFLRMITVYLDITAPLYWWKEFDTYKVGTVINSCSTMHKIHAKEFTLDDFSCEKLRIAAKNHLIRTIEILNIEREEFLTQDIPVFKKDAWWQMIQLLPSSYNQKRTVMLNYEVLANIYKYRRNHKLDEWHTLCDWIESLPYSELIRTEEEK